MFRSWTSPGVGRADHGALARLGGVELTEITAETTYQLPSSSSDVVAERGVQSSLPARLAAPNHQEVHLRTLSLGVGDTRRLADGQEALVRYGNQTVTVSGLELQRRRSGSR